MKALMLQTHWEKTLHPMLDIIGRFPKAQRFVFGQPMAKLVLDILLEIQACRYLPKTQQHEALSRLNHKLDQLQLLFRVCHDRRFLSTSQLEWLATECQSFGRGLHAWKKTCPPSNA